MKSYNPEKRKEQLERNIADFKRIFKQEVLRWELSSSMLDAISVWKDELKEINKLLKKRKEQNEE